MALIHAIKQGNIKEIKQLIMNGEIVTLNSSGTGTTPLIEACKFGDKDLSKRMVKILLKHGANVNHTDKQGRNALHWACLQGNKQIMNALTGSQSSIDFIMTDSKGNSILFYAVETGNCSFVRFVCKLYKINCVKDIGKNKKGLSAADLALKLGHKQCSIMCKEVTRRMPRELAPITDQLTQNQTAAYINDHNQHVVLPPIAPIPEDKGYQPGRIAPKLGRKGKNGDPVSLGVGSFHPQARRESDQSDEIIGKIDYRCVLNDLNWMNSVEFTSSYRPGVDEKLRLEKLKKAVKKVSIAGTNHDSYLRDRRLPNNRRTKGERQGRKNIEGIQSTTK